MKSTNISKNPLQIKMAVLLERTCSWSSTEAMLEDFQ